MTPLHVVTFLLSCVQQRRAFCTREIMPVCGNGTTYNNMCLAEAAGFYGNCASNVKMGSCADVNTRLTCAQHETLSETGICVHKPWSDFSSCEEEKRQGACPNGNDPNPWVGEHCAITCSVHI